MATTASLLQTPGIIGVWNYSISNCSAFRNDTVKLFFRAWPETLDGGFTYCCQDGTKNLSLSNFTYGPTQGALDPRPYFDLGAVSQFKNYWKAWTFWKVPTKDIYYPLYCDYTDLHSLYVSRFWRHTLPLGVETGILLCVILQALVLIAWFCQSEKRKKLWDAWFGQEMQVLPKEMRKEKLKEKLVKWFWRSGWADLISDLVHLMLLAVIGDCMMEAVGHSNLHMWRASIMYNAGAVYSYLTLLAMVSSFLRQLAPHSDDNDTRKVNDQPWDDAVKRLKDVPDDWRWQRVFGQVGVLVLMGAYLALVDDDTGSSMDNLADVVLAAVAAASIWSAGSTALAGFRAVVFLLLTEQ